MRWIFLVSACLGAAVTGSGVSDLKMIDELNDCVRVRFETPQTVFITSRPGMSMAAPALGMSRIGSPPSQGHHFVPDFNVSRDFTPEDDREKKIVAMLEETPLHVGLYVFGRAIIDSDVEKLNYRALKGPAAMTAGSPRPNWYPASPLGSTQPREGSLPDWKAVYPLARKAMKSFNDGGAGFDTEMDSWMIAARPVVASQARCLECHNVAMNQPIGGVLYAYHRTESH